ncbi:MAG TPA: ABC transporter ATP-binding protein [Gammaproteobacteria bacterium]|nr:ABC transporter ATP-binding protein [Gammaproteobacteria bacterium]
MLNTHALDVEIGGKQVCRGLDLTLARGECMAVLGGNGVGKTTLLHTLAGLREPHGGDVRLDDQPLARLSRREVARRLALLMQHDDDAFPATVRETVLVGRHPHIAFWRWESRGDVAIAEAALTDCALGGFEDRAVDTLSGGERRRLAIATVLAQQPSLYLLDEPTNELDLHFQIDLLRHFRKLADDEGKAVLLAMHDVNLAARFADRALLLFGHGETLCGPAAETLTEENLSRLYHVRVETGQIGSRRFFMPAVGASFLCD